MSVPFKSLPQIPEMTAGVEVWREFRADLDRWKQRAVARVNNRKTDAPEYRVEFERLEIDRVHEFAAVGADITIELVQPWADTHTGEPFAALCFGEWSVCQCEPCVNAVSEYDTQLEAAHDRRQLLLDKIDYMIFDAADDRADAMFDRLLPDTAATILEGEAHELLYVECIAKAHGEASKEWDQLVQEMRRTDDLLAGYQAFGVGGRIDAA